MREEGREDDRVWGRGRSVLGCDGSGFAIGDDESVLRSGFAIGVRYLGSRGVRDLGSRSGFAIWVREGFVIWVREVEQRSRTNSKSDGEPIVLSLFFLSLSLSLSLCAGASSSPSVLSLFSGKFLFEGKIETEINLHLFKGQLKSISGKCIFRAQPNTRKKVKSISGNAFHPKQTQPYIQVAYWC